MGISFQKGAGLKSQIRSYKICNILEAPRLGQRKTINFSKWSKKKTFIHSTNIYCLWPTWYTYRSLKHSRIHKTEQLCPPSEYTLIMGETKALSQTCKCHGENLGRVRNIEKDYPGVGGRGYLILGRQGYFEIYSILEYKNLRK